MSGVPPHVIAERRVLRRLLHSRATSPASAMRLDDLRWLQRRRLIHLMANGVVREARPEAYYLDESAYAVYRGKRQRVVIVAMVLALLAAASALLMAPR
jgi:hypothetical protein